jgi:hypothetical protein
MPLVVFLMDVDAVPFELEMNKAGDTNSLAVKDLRPSHELHNRRFV